MPINDLGTLLQSMNDRLRTVEERDAERLTQSVGEQWTLAENDAGVLVARVGEDEGPEYVLVDPQTATQATTEPVNPDDAGSGEQTGEPSDCDCPPGPQGPPGPEGPPGPAGEGSGFSPSWTDYVPTWSTTGTAPNVGNGTLRGTYVRAGNIVWYHIRMTWGSATTNGTGTFRFELPATPAVGVLAAMGTVMMFDASLSAIRPRIANYAATSPDRVSVLDMAGALVTGTVPWTWANGDILDISGSYEAA